MTKKLIVYRENQFRWEKYYKITTLETGKVASLLTGQFGLFRRVLYIRPTIPEISVRSHIEKGQFRFSPTGIIGTTSGGAPLWPVGQKYAVPFWQNGCCPTSLCRKRYKMVLGGTVWAENVVSISSGIPTGLDGIMQIKRKRSRSSGVRVESWEEAGKKTWRYF